MKLIMRLCIILLIANYQDASAQCSCMAGAAVGGASPLSGASNVGVLKKGALRLSLGAVYSFGDQNYEGDVKTDLGIIKSYSAAYSVLSAGYGLTDDFTLDAEAAYFIDKTQAFRGGDLISGSGLSHFTIMPKYNALTKRAREIEWTIGAGAKIPAAFDNPNLPQNIQPSSRAFGFSAMSFLRKGFKDIGFQLILIDRAEYNTENSSGYQYGLSFTNSLYGIKSIASNLMGILELRSDVRLKDKSWGNAMDDSGASVIVLSPQLAYSFSNFAVTAFVDFPVYRFYNGIQLANKGAFGIAFNWNLSRI
jgi:hypothetical protein